MNLKDARDSLAAALNAAVPGLRVKGRPGKGQNLRKNDGWVTFNTGQPSDFLTEHTAILNAYIILGADESAADELVDEMTFPLLDALADWFGYNITIRPQAIVAGEGVPGTLYALALTLTVDVSS